ncbi:arginine--tRNA ligase [Candidatus Kaiserbacteria bacterium]|nr:arginine--tRNA ligase [Candidatus Kaiserbacteria bacterium]
MEERIREAVANALETLSAPAVAFVVERPTDPTHGDYTTNAAMAAARVLEKNLREVASDLARHLQNALGADASRIEIAGPGFVNITLSQGAVSLLVAEAEARGEDWGKGNAEKGKRVIVEYSNPNPFKEMHIGHLMSTIIGEAISRLVENEGAIVARDSYGGDVGPHVAKAVWGLQKAGITEPTTAREIGDAYAEGSRAYEESPEIQAEIDALNKAIYVGTDADLMELWRKGRDISLEAFRDLYRVLGTKFDYYFFESETAGPGERIVRDGLAKGIFEESDGAVIYRGEKKGLHTLVFITSRGTPTYEAKDIGLAFLKEERWPSDHSIIITAAEQSGHFKVFFAALAEIGPALAKKTSHVPHGFLRLMTGKMSSRAGNVITAAGLIQEVEGRAREKNKDPLIAEHVAVGAIKYMILRQAPGSDIVFDEEKSLSLEGDSGPYLQYALVRAKSVIAKKIGAPAAGAPREPYVLERLLIHFPEIAARAARERSPNLLTTYLTELAGAWNAFYAEERIIGGDYEAHKLMLARAFAQTMVNGLKLLGIPALEKM